MSSVTYTQDISKIENSDSQFCKKCDLQIFEGHAYELGDDRWHINCFKCSKCDMSLGCNSNFLVLGNGNLICSNCSYNCKQCNKKIDDLAILTGDQAYCSSCFKCRSCKQKIEDLRYARTSKGLFCMSCHEKLIAKKKKYDAKKRQLALLQQQKEESERERERETELSVASSQKSALSHNGIYNLGNNSSSSVSIKHKNFPSAPTSKTSSHSQKGSPLSNKPYLDSRESFHSSKSEFIGGQSNYPDLPEKGRASSNNASNDDFSIEEVNDSDDELNKRNSQRSENSESKKNSVLTSNYKTPRIPETPVLGNNDNGSILLDIINTPDSPASVKKLKPSIDLNQKENNELNKSPPTNHKNIFILSPKQFQDNEFDGLNRSPIYDSPRDRKSKSSEITDRDSNNLYVAFDAKRSHSPMASVNRQARVMEVGDYPLKEGNEEESSFQLQASQITTPKKNKTTGLGVSSPPPKMPVPSTPSRNESDIPDSTPKGLGLEGIPIIDGSEQYNRIREEGTKVSPFQMNTTPRTIGNNTPTVTNLEDDMTEEKSSNLSRKNTLIRTPKLNIRHKRSISGGNGGIANKLGFFRSNSSKYEEPIEAKGHTRHVSEGSIINSNSAFVTPPLPKTSPTHYTSVYKTSQYEKSHNRLTSDTPFLTSLDLHEEENRVAPLRFEVESLEKQKKNLAEEIKKMIEQKDNLLSNLKEIQQQFTSYTDNIRLLKDEVKELELTKRDLFDANEILLEENRQLSASLNEATPIEKTNSEASRSVYDGEASSSTNMRHSFSPSIIGPSFSSETIINEEPVVDTQKATRLKFWRRPKASNANIGNQTPQMGNSTNKMSHSYSSYALNLPQESNGYHNDNLTVEKKGLSSFVTRSRSTNILDTFLNSNLNDSVEEPTAPLFSSTIQKRANYERSSVPLIVKKCIAEVEKRGLDIEGIYRISGGNSAIVAIENAFANFPQEYLNDEKQIHKLDSVFDGDINAVTSALKRYLRKLPDPLIPYDLYDEFIKICSTIPQNDEERRITEMKCKIINVLPPANKETLSLLCKHLDLINSYSSINRMGMKNLSVVFAPTLARDETGTREILDMGHRNDVTEFLFNNYKKIF